MHDIPGPSKPTRAKQNIITPRLAAVLNKCKISDRDTVHLLTAVAECFQVNCSEFVINRTSIKKVRENIRKQTSETIKTNFLNFDLNFVVLHWDSKLLPDLLNRKNVERLPIIVTAPNVEKLLGIPPLISGAGKDICSAVHNTLQE